MTALYDGSVSSALNYDFYVKSDEPCTVYILCYYETGIDISMLNTYPVSFGIWHELHVTEGIKYDPNKLSE